MEKELIKCDKCGGSLPPNHFPRWKNKHGEGLRSTCKNCLDRIKRGLPIQDAHYWKDLDNKLLEAVDHSSLYVQFLVQEIITEGIRDHRKTIENHKFYAREVKKLFSDACKRVKDYDIKVGRHYSEDNLDKIDNCCQHFINDIKDLRTQLYDVIAKEYAGHKDKKLICSVEYLNASAIVVKAFYEIAKEKYAIAGLSRCHLDEFSVHGAGQRCIEVAKLCRKLYRYNSPITHELHEVMARIVHKIDRTYLAQMLDTEIKFLGEDGFKEITNRANEVCTLLSESIQT